MSEARVDVRRPLAVLLGGSPNRQRATEPLARACALLRRRERPVGASVSHRAEPPPLALGGRLP